ncbi:response regulator [Rhizobiales bacterium]|uniref:response regulator n=1 Tax=Hongsoonwoonella zoysiae TaxID=2821844 RepID=UPI00155F6EE6|nr:response regulator [Hongsoonwoonella zoysiae]NRG17460.1 response regulator [Hongsoonwoonella zoysiae]
MTNKKLIIADEQPVIARCLKGLLTHEGYDVEATASADRLLEIVRGGGADLILIDADLPRQNGISVCQALKANPATRDLPIVVMSASARAIETEKATALGADAVLRKPFTLDDLKGALVKLRAGEARTALHA